MQRVLLSTTVVALNLAASFVMADERAVAPYLKQAAPMQNGAAPVGYVWISRHLEPLHFKLPEGAQNGDEFTTILNAVIRVEGDLPYAPVRLLSLQVGNAGLASLAQPGG